ncbi:hypothetical protein GIB67_038731, partial [Kingdonia uniflora]
MDLKYGSQDTPTPLEQTFKTDFTKFVRTDSQSIRTKWVLSILFEQINSLFEQNFKKTFFLTVFDPRSFHELR